LHRKTLLPNTICSVSEFSEAAIVEGPQDTVSFVGDTAELQCLTNDSNDSYIEWTRGPAGPTVASPFVVNSGYTVNDSTEGQFDLVINSTQRHDADTYRCLVDFESGVSADLTVLGTFCCLLRLVLWRRKSLNMLHLLLLLVCSGIEGGPN